MRESKALGARISADCVAGRPGALLSDLLSLAIYSSGVLI